jgi:hypothetical protein
MAAESGPPPAKSTTTASVTPLSSNQGRRMLLRSVSAPSSMFAVSALMSAAALLCIVVAGPRRRRRCRRGVVRPVVAHYTWRCTLSSVSRTRARASGDVCGDGPSCLRAQPAGDDVLSERSPWVEHNQAALWSVIGCHMADFPLFLPDRETSRPHTPVESTILALARRRDALVQSSGT